MATKEATEKNIWKELRKPFPKEVIGKLPRGGIQLDYVGHAAVTDRLLEVDPEWTWEPMATDEQGVPVFVTGSDQFNKPTKGLWIKLTVGGITRPGYGDGKSEKECIGDAIRNGAMRFGVALDLWSKEELHPAEEKPSEPPTTPDESKSPGQQMMDSIAELKEKFAEKGYTDSATKLTFCKNIIGKQMPSTVDEYKKVIEALDEVPF